MTENTGVYSLIKTISDEKVTFNNKFDALVLMMHLIAKKEGFICVGTDAVDDKANHVIPPNWNKSSDSYTFRYRHPSTDSAVYILKYLPMESTLIVHGMIQDQKTSHHMEIQSIDDYISSAPLDNIDHLFYNIDELISTFNTSILDRFLNRSAPPKSAPEKTQTQTNTTPIYDPLREPPRRPPQRYYPDDEPSPFSPPFGIGRNDVFPNIPMGPGGWGPGSGGNLIGPNHPGFGPGVTDPYAFPGNRGRGNYPPGLPPGARFDPYAPPGVGRPSNPDPDNEPPPPGYGNMFL